MRVNYIIMNIQNIHIKFRATSFFPSKYDESLEGYAAKPYIAQEYIIDLSNLDRLQNKRIVSR